MTEKEFENLKIGDRVWSVTNIWQEGKGLYEMKVVGKRIDLAYIETSWLDGSHKTNFFRLDCQTSKVKAFEAVIACCEAHIKDKENDIAYEKKELERFKAGLAKAKEEERRKEWWYVSYKQQMVAKLPLVMDSDAEAEIFETEREAHEALADYYKGKYEEELRKACVVRYFVCGKRIITLHDCYEFWGGNFYGYDYDGQKHCSVHRGENIFSTRQEAEAELERRQKRES